MYLKLARITWLMCCGVFKKYTEFEIILSRIARIGKVIYRLLLFVVFS
jgi:hypothetical protein